MREISYKLRDKLENFFQEELDWALRKRQEAEDDCDSKEYQFWDGYHHAILRTRQEIRKYED